MKSYEKKEEKNYDDQVEGRNSVLELLESGRDINKIYVQAGEKHGSIYKIIAMAKERKVLIRSDRETADLAVEKLFTLNS